MVIFDSLFLSLFIALTDHSATCSEKIVNLHEAALEEIEKASEENGKILMDIDWPVKIKYVCWGQDQRVESCTMHGWLV